MEIMREIPHTIARDPATGVQIRIGVMGSAGGRMTPALASRCRLLGRAIAEQGCCLLTGACPGLPHETVLGAKEAHGHIVGISPAVDLKEHVERFRSPYREYDVLIFTGMGLMGREIINIHSSDVVIIVGGRSGTLGEFAIAYESGKLIGVFKNTGGISATIQQLEEKLSKKTGAKIIYGSDPVRLVDVLLKRYCSKSIHVAAPSIENCTALD
ncbi:MAG: SLOG cluster 4 domain-containing protein [Syntrophales bacterium]